MSNEKLEMFEKLKEKSGTMRTPTGKQRSFWKEYKQINRPRFYFFP